MAELHPISGTNIETRIADVIFVHGLGGDDQYTSWPHRVEGEFKDVGVWSFGELHSDVSQNLPAHSIQCMSCGAEGSVESSEEGAVKRWNTRTVPAKETS